MLERAHKPSPQHAATHKPRRPWLALGLAAALSIPGCKSHSPSHYVSPRVEGRVLAAETHQPIAGVRVRRVTPDYQAGTLEPVKGGESLQREAPAVSAADGSFNLDSQKSVALFRDLAWFTVEVSFNHRDYVPFVTNYTPRMAVTLPSGEPVIHAGDVLLSRKSE